MRNFTLAALFILCGFSLHAQFSPGTKIISGNFYFNLLNTSTSTVPDVVQHQSYIGIDGARLRFKSPTSLSGFGLALGYSNYHTTGVAASTTRSNSYSISAFLSRVKLEPLSATFFLAFTGSAGASYGFGKIDNTTNADYNRTRGYSVYVSGALGIWYKLHERFLLSCDLNNLLNISVGHNTSESHNGANVNTTKQTGVNVRTGLSGFGLNTLGIGVRYVLK